MRKQTDLDEIKRTAITLLHTDIYETPYSPMIVKHPFADTGLTALPDGNGGITMIAEYQVIPQISSIPSPRRFGTTANTRQNIPNTSLSISTQTKV